MLMYAVKSALLMRLKSGRAPTPPANVGLAADGGYMWDAGGGGGSGAIGRGARVSHQPQQRADGKDAECTTDEDGASDSRSQGRLVVESGADADVRCMHAAVSPPAAPPELYVGSGEDDEDHAVAADAPDQAPGDGEQVPLVVAGDSMGELAAPPALAPAPASPTGEDNSGGDGGAGADALLPPPRVPSSLMTH
jgi:hypothetical protein